MAKYSAISDGYVPLKSPVASAKRTLRVAIVISGNSVLSLKIRWISRDPGSGEVYFEPIH